MNFPKLDDMASWIELPTLRSLEINFLLYTGKSYAPPLSVYARAIEPGRLWLDRALMIAFMCAMARVAWYTLKRVADAKNDADGKPPRVFCFWHGVLYLNWCFLPLHTFCNPVLSPATCYTVQHRFISLPAGQLHLYADRRPN